MAFLQRVIGYLVNELSDPAADLQVLVSGLANSKTFQRFAVKSNDMFQEMSKKGVEGKSRYTDQISEFSKTFRQEMQKGVDEHFGRGQSKRH